ncbi:AraC family transcriptional regulator [Actinobacteria bacterium YIM 96077]|uniref:AraC family transcriptional regulator n=1 Tax=Phytoactinopolyspora halophila TaxID=1981511 RepID=A0A329QAA2_9ACTN|nr:AraC family transcriptional regulator [Phytoactinopolyspora halophila]AYY12478.1 AraC family transcriptional regulator [Actinobacteria bacterium YIM 96077]RAW09325.1 AraC family transcriptional regulator [Phytoactinopolyspora halophila]
MVSLFREPSPVLAPFVDVLWYIDEPLPPGRERTIPTGAAQLVVNLHEDTLRWFDSDHHDVHHREEPGHDDEDGGARAVRAAHRTSGSGLIGALTRPLIIDNADQRATVGVAFRPGGAAAFFHPPANVLAEPVIALDSLWGRDGAVLRERLLEQRTPESALQVFESVLLQRVVSAPDSLVGKAVERLSTGARVDEVVDWSGLTSTTFNRRFRSAVGLNPKAFARVRRLQRVLRAVNGYDDAGAGGGHGAGDGDWSTVAVEHGYYDQAHLINEFRMFTGVTPTAYRPRSPGASNHLPLPSRLPPSADHEH